jgi:hypothetical protein
VSPTDCASLSARCPALASSFHIAGKPLPCTPEESAGKPVHTGDDIYGADGCRPVPARFIVLGDSIADCTGVTGDGCAPDLIVAYLQTHGAPDVVLETHAKDGAVVADLRQQAEEVQGGPGHVYVWTYAIGNDLLAGNPDGATLVEGYASMFDYFTDSDRFPEGATFLLNTQYNPKDECTPPGVMRRPGIDALIRQLNQQVFIDVAEARDDTVAVDQLPDFLGHGDNADITGCPYCGADNTPWLFSIHPNALGHAHIAAKWEVALAAMLGPGCGR